MRSGTKLFYIVMAGILALVVVYGFRLRPESVPNPSNSTNSTNTGTSSNTITPAPVVDHATKAATLYQQKDYAGAATEYNLAIAAESEPAKRAELYNLLGNSLRDEAKLAEALAAYKQAYTLAPTLTVAYINAANVYVTEKNTTAAKAVITEGLQQNPGNQDLTNKQAVLDLNGSGAER